jgi:hypothetical protein
MTSATHFDVRTTARVTFVEIAPRAGEDPV